MNTAAVTCHVVTRFKICVGGNKEEAPHEAGREIIQNIRHIWDSCEFLQQHFADRI